MSSVLINFFTKFTSNSGRFNLGWTVAWSGCPPTGTLRQAILALLTVRIRPLFWLFVVAFNLVGAVDLILDYYHAVRVGLPAIAGQLGVAYVIPVLYVPVLMITHIVAFYLLMRPQPKVARTLVHDVVSA
jgi:hypothetical protein